MDIILPEPFDMEPYQTVDKGSTNYKAGYNAAIREIAALKAGQGEAVATIQLPDIYNERAGLWLSNEDLKRLSALPAGTKLYTAPPATADAVSVPIPLLLECVSQLEMAGAWELPGKLSALLAQSQKVK